MHSVSAKSGGREKSKDSGAENIHLGESRDLANFTGQASTESEVAADRSEQSRTNPNNLNDAHKPGSKPNKAYALINIAILTT